MYTIFIVDDEQEVRTGIIQKIEWSKYGFEISGEAENGREALEMIEKNPPDVVVTDIKMPFMDGLELVAEIKENFPTIKVIILTGFDDFKYAQEAIKYSVVEYILKPVLPEDIEKLLFKLKTQLDDEFAQKEDIKRLKEHYIKSLPVMKDKFLTTLITTRQKKPEAEMKIKSYGLNLKGCGFAVAVISQDNKTVNEGNFSDEDAELVKFAIFNMADEIVKKHSLGEVFFHNDYLVVIASLETFDKTRIYNRTYLAVEEIRQSVEKYLKLTVTISIGSICSGIEHLTDSYKSALKALDYKLLMGNNRVIYIEDLEPQLEDNIVFDEDKEAMLSTSVKFGTDKDVEAAVDNIFKDFKDCRASFRDCQIYLLEVIAAILKISRSLQLDMKEVLGLSSNLFEEINKFNTIEEVKRWITGICLTLTKRISDKRRDTCKVILEKAKDYIKNNYYDEDISINKVSSYLHISPSYLSLIFKRETGETFLNYLIRIRLEVAKELLKTTNLKTAEIAERIGYSDPHYFSYFFKKNFGMSPREYKNSLIT